MKSRLHKALMIAGTVVLIVTAIAFVASLPGLMERRVQALRTEGNWDAAMTIEGRLVRLFPRSESARNAVLGLLSNLSVGPTEVLISGSGWVSSRGGSAPTDPESTAARVLEHVDRIAPKQRMSMWTHNLTEDRAMLLAELGRLEEAKESMLSAIEGFSSDGAEWRVVEARIEMIEWEDDPKARIEAAQSLLQSEELMPFQVARLELIAADALLDAGRFAEAREAYERALEAEAEKIGAAAANDNRPVAVLSEQPVHVRATFALSYLDFLQAGTNGENDSPVPGSDGEADTRRPGTVTGEITLNGEPTEGVDIYLTPVEYARLGSPSGQIELRSFTGTTDTNGRFRLDSLPPDRYRLTLGLTTERLVDVGRREIPDVIELEPGETFELRLSFHPVIGIVEPEGTTSVEAGGRVGIPVRWEPLEGASDYAVRLLVFMLDDGGRITGWSTQTLAASVPESEYRVDLSGVELYAYGGVRYDPGLDPIAVLGPWIPGNPVGLQIEAVDDTGRVIADSEGYLFRGDRNYPMLQMSGTYEQRFGAAADAAKLTYDRDFPAAIEAWKTLLSSEGVDEGARAVAALALARLSLYLPKENGRDLDRVGGYYREFVRLAGGTSEVPGTIFRELRGYLEPS